MAALGLTLYCNNSRSIWLLHFRDAAFNFPLSQEEFRSPRTDSPGATEKTLIGVLNVIEAVSLLINL